MRTEYVQVGKSIERVQQLLLDYVDPFLWVFMQVIHMGTVRQNALYRCSKLIDIPLP